MGPLQRPTSNYHTLPRPPGHHNPPQLRAHLSHYYLPLPRLELPGRCPWHHPVSHRDLPHTRCPRHTDPPKPAPLPHHCCPCHPQPSPPIPRSSQGTQPGHQLLPHVQPSHTRRPPNRPRGARTHPNKLPFDPHVCPSSECHQKMVQPRSTPDRYQPCLARLRPPPPTLLSNLPRISTSPGVYPIQYPTNASTPCALQLPSSPPHHCLYTPPTPCYPVSPSLLLPLIVHSCLRPPTLCRGGTPTTAEGNL